MLLTAECQSCLDRLALFEFFQVRFHRELKYLDLMSPQRIEHLLWPDLKTRVAGSQG